MEHARSSPHLVITTDHFGLGLRPQLLKRSLPKEVIQCPGETRCRSCMQEGMRAACCLEQDEPCRAVTTYEVASAAPGSWRPPFTIAEAVVTAMAAAQCTLVFQPKQCRTSGMLSRLVFGTGLRLCRESILGIVSATVDLGIGCRTVTFEIP